MVGIESTRTLYVYDSGCKCIWKIHLETNKVKKWLWDLEDYICLSVTSDNHLLVLRHSLQGATNLETYDQNAKLLRGVSLPDLLSYANGAVQQANGDFIISQSLNVHSGMLVTILSTDGHVISKSKLEEINGWYYERYCLYLVNNYLFVAERFYQNIGWMDPETLITYPMLLIVVHSISLCCDGKENQFVVVTRSGVHIFTLNIN